MDNPGIMKSDHLSLSQHSQRKSNKPLLEKKRRARINKSLDQLKGLVLEALKKDTARYSKLEKADILEMTVKHLRDVQHQQMAVAMSIDPTVIPKYQTGFSECSQEVNRYLSTIDGLSPDVRVRLMTHLMNSQNVASQTPYIQNVMYQMPPTATHIGVLPGYGGVTVPLPEQVYQTPAHAYTADIYNKMASLNAHSPDYGRVSPTNSLCSESSIGSDDDSFERATMDYKDIMDTNNNMANNNGISTGLSQQKPHKPLSERQPVHENIPIKVQKSSNVIVDKKPAVTGFSLSPENENRQKHFVPEYQLVKQEPVWRPW